MKKLKYLLLIITILFVFPLSASAKEKINIYFFRGEGCPHCQEAEEFFDSIEDKYGKYYNIIDYETWYDKNNASLMEKVAEKLGEKASGVPYIIIGKKTWNGYASDFDSDIKKAIKDEYNKKISDRYDVIKDLNKKDSSSISTDILSILIIVLIVGGITFGIIMARKKSS